MCVLAHCTMKRTILYLILLFSALAVSGQPLYFDRIDTRYGLSQNTVNEIIQDSRGFMWFGTKDGLNRYDGTHFKIFKSIPNRPCSLGNNQIRAIVEGKDGRIYIGTNAGLFVYDTEKDRFSEIKLQDASGGGISNPVLCVEMDPGGRIWVSVEAAGVYCYEPGASEAECRYSTKKPLHTMAIDMKTGVIWFSWPGEGLYYTDDDFASITPFLTTDGDKICPQDIISCIYISDYNRIFLGMEKGGVMALNKATSQLSKLPLSDNALFVRQILQYSSDELWIGTESGLYIYNITAKEVSHFESLRYDPYSLSDNSIHSMCKDKEGGLWLGTFFGGVNYLPGKVPDFNKYYYTDGSNGLYGIRIKEICPDGKGGLWVGTEDAGLYNFSPETGRFTFFEPSREFPNIHSLVMDGDKLWVSTFAHSIRVIDTVTGKVRKYDANSSYGDRLFSNYVFALEMTSTGRLYVGTMHGLQYYNADTDNFGYVPEINGGKMVNTIMEDSGGDLWVSTVSNGLYRLHGESGVWTQYIHRTDDPGSVPCNNIISIFEDSSRRIWITTEGYGVSLYDSATDSFRTFNSIDGLPSDVVYQIVEDGYGNFWMSTNRGLALFNPQSYEVKRIYTTENGLLCDQFNYHSSYRSQDGTIWLGSVEGLISFRPDVLLSEIESYMPPIFITDFTLMNQDIEVGAEDSPLKKDITYTDDLKLRHYQNNFTISFAALGYRKNNELVYRMDGIDSKWNRYDGGAVTYSNVSSGNYVFRAKLENDAEGAGERMLNIRVAPPVYFSTVAKMLYMMMFAGLLLLGIYLYHRRAVRKRGKYIMAYEKKKEQEVYEAKIKFFTNVTHEIRTPLTLIKGPLENIINNGKANPEIAGDLNIIHRNTDRLLVLVNQLLDFQNMEKENIYLNLRPEKVSGIVADISERFSLSFREGGKDCEVNITDKNIYAMVDKEAFTKIVSNMFINALKYSDHIIRITLDRDGGMCRLVVVNDGDLIPENKRDVIFQPFYRYTNTGDKAGSGIGLFFAKSLAELHGGSLTMDVFEGMNEFVLKVPLYDPVSAEEEATQIAIAEILDGGNESSLPVETGGNIILVVEDEPEMREFIKSVLEGSYNVVTAENGIEALKVIVRNEISMIVSDVMMPELDGITLCRTLKKDVRYSHIPFIMLTAKTDLESRVEGMNAGADSYVEKPFSSEYLISVIANQFKSRKMLSESFVKNPLGKLNFGNLSANDIDFLVRLQQVVDGVMIDPELKVGDIADMMNMGRRDLYRKMDSLLGMTPKTFLRIERLKKAARLLKEESIQVKEVCYMVGFNTPSYFIRCFVQQFGETPLSFVNNLSKNNKNKNKTKKSK